MEGVRAQSKKVHYEVGTITIENEQSLTLGMAKYASIVLFPSKGISFESIVKHQERKYSCLQLQVQEGTSLINTFSFVLLKGSLHNKITFWIFFLVELFLHGA